MREMMFGIDVQDGNYLTDVIERSYHRGGPAALLKVKKFADSLHNVPDELVNLR